jgi:hypothetical protein
MAGRPDGSSAPRSPRTWSTDVVACTPPGTSAGPSASRGSALCPKSFGQVGSGSWTRSPTSAPSGSDPMRSPRSGGVNPAGHAIGSAGSFQGASSGGDAEDIPTASIDRVASPKAALPVASRTPLPGESPLGGSPARPSDSPTLVRARASGASEPSARPASGSPAAGDAPSASTTTPSADTVSVAGSLPGSSRGPTSAASAPVVSPAPAAPAPPTPASDRAADGCSTRPPASGGEPISGSGST